MGICYSEQQQWQAYKQNRKGKYRRKPSKKSASVIYEEQSTYSSSFASNAYQSFREDLHHTISSIAADNGQVIMGSLVEMKEEELDKLYKSLHKINSDGELHHIGQAVILCNLKTKNYLHTHKIKHPQCKLFNEISCCPYTSNHIPEYDIWKFIRVEKDEGVRREKEEGKEARDQEEGNEGKDQKEGKEDNGDEIEEVYIYHPFTQRFMAYQKGAIVGSESKMAWRVHSFGPRRNGGFIKISSPTGQVCMSQQKGLLQKHRKVQICSEKHISHIWEIHFADPDLI